MQNFTETLVTLIHPTYGCDFPTAGDLCAKQIAGEKNRGGGGGAALPYFFLVSTHKSVLCEPRQDELSARPQF